MRRGPSLYPTVTRKFLADQAFRYVESTRREYARWLIHLQAQHPGKRIEQFTEDDLVEWITAGDVSSATIGKRKQVVRAVFEWAAWKGLIVRNPAVGLNMRLRTPRRPVRSNNWLTGQERAALLGACEDGEIGQRDRMVLLLGLLCGLRRAEIAGLRWSNVDLINRTITFTGKGRKLSTVGIPKQLYEELFTWRSEQVLARGRPVAGTDPLIVRLRNRIVASNSPGKPAKGSTHPVVMEVTPEWDKPLSIKGVHNILMKLSERAGVRVRAHDLRRTFAGMLEDQGKDIKDISRAMRHESMATTAVYMERNPARTIAVTEDLVV